MQWQRSPAAIMAHAVFLLLIGLLTSEVLAGNWGPTGDYPLGVAYRVMAYPAVLLSLWLNCTPFPLSRIRQKGIMVFEWLQRIVQLRNQKVAAFCRDRSGQADEKFVADCGEPTRTRRFEP